MIEQLEEALAPIEEFERMHPVSADKADNSEKDSGDNTGNSGLYEMEFQKVPTRTVNLSERIESEMPESS